MSSDGSPPPDALTAATTGTSPLDRLSVVIVTHHSAAVIGGCLESFPAGTDFIVVDNASDDDTLEIVERLAPQARIVRNAVGVGYGNAANQGLALVEREFALTANPDIELPETTIAELVAAADRYPEAAIVSPQLLNLDGSVEPTHDVPMFVRHDIARRHHKRAEEPAPAGDVAAEFVSGAVNLIRMSALREVGAFDPNIFLYFDDDDLCLRFRQAGWSLVVAPKAVATHVNGGSVRPSLHYRWEKYWHYGWSRLYIERKYRGAGAAWALGFKHLLRFFPKALLYSLTFNGKKALRDWARGVGTVAYLIGCRAVPRRDGDGRG